MNIKYVLGIIYLFIAVFPLTLAVLSYRTKEKTTINRFLFFIYLLLTHWVLCNAFKQFSLTENGVLFWQAMKYTGIAFLPVFILMAAIEFSQFKPFFKTMCYKALFIMASIIVMVMLTNPFHHFFYKTISVSMEPFVSLQWTNGLWYWILTFYSFLLIILAVVSILIDFIRQPRIYKTKPAIILAGILIPTVLNILYDSAFTDQRFPIEVTPLTFIVSMLFVYYALYIYKPSHVIPIARDLIVDNTYNPIILFDNNYFTLDINKAFSSLLGADRKDWIGRSVNEYPPSFRSFLPSPYLKHKQPEQLVSIAHQNAMKYYKCNSLVLRDRKNKAIGQLTVLSDISELKATMDRLEYLSMHDQLTGLKNRMYFEKQLHYFDREPYLPLGVIIGDVNGLKMVNDAFGHETGDLLLKKAALAIARCCIGQYTVARMAGDEFAILLPKTGEETMIKLIRQIKQVCSATDSLPTQLSISFGYAIKYNNNDKIINIMKQADEMMYRQKMLERRSIRSTMMETLLQALAERNIETEEHLERTREQAVELGKRLDLPGYLLDDLSLLALLHDIGKLGVPDHILLKPGKLNAEEWEIMKQHSIKGYSIAAAMPELISIAQAILYHHERWDGMGYPYGLHGEQTPLLSRIIAVVDAFDVMTHDRCYHRAISAKAALQEIKRCSGTQFDPAIAQVFIEMKQEERRGLNLLDQNTAH